MTKTAPSFRFKSLYVARFLLEASGVLLTILCILGSTVVYGLLKGLHGGHNLHTAMLRTVFVFVAAIGLLIPPLWAKFVSSLLVVSAGAWLFYTEAYLPKNLGIYCLFLIPFLLPLTLTLWLRAGYHHFKIKRLPSANQFSN